MWADVGQEGHVASALEGNTERALVAGAGAGLAARLDLRPFRKVLPKSSDVLIVDRLDLIYTECAHLSARHVAVTRARPAAGATLAAEASSASTASTVTTTAPTAA